MLALLTHPLQACYILMQGVSRTCPEMDLVLFEEVLLNFFFFFFCHVFDWGVSITHPCWLRFFFFFFFILFYQASFSYTCLAFVVVAFKKIFVCVDFLLHIPR